MVLNYLPGGELFYRLKREGRFSVERVRLYTAEIGLGLGHLHSLDMIYRDLKPENILLDEVGHVCLTDFGLSKEMVTSHNSARTFCACKQTPHQPPPMPCSAAAGASPPATAPPPPRPDPPAQPSGAAPGRRPRVRGSHLRTDRRVLPLSRPQAARPSTSPQRSYRGWGTARRWTGGRWAR
jgi:serine/threonine protein kinase